jgi:ankyrin repeat protein
VSSQGSAPAQQYPPLYAATLAGDRAAVDRLVRTPVDVNWRNADNHWPALTVAADAGNAEIVADLLRRDDLDVNITDDLGQTPLHIAADRGQGLVIDALLADARVDVNPRDVLQRTPLVAAALAGRADAVERLLADDRTEVNAADRDRQTALHWAAVLGHLDVVRLLVVDRRTDTAITSLPDERTAAELAVAAGRYAAAAIIDPKGPA